MLGCGKYEVCVFTRGGGTLVAILPWTQLQWSRILDDTSSATVGGVIGQDSDCCAALADIYPWEHEIVIYRNNEIVWVGPIFQMSTPPGSFSIEARDLTAWWDRRLVHNDVNLPETDLATIFQAIADDAMAPDPSPNLTVRTTASKIKGSRRILALQHQEAGPALRDLANVGIDWTAVGRTVLAGGLVIPTQPIGTLTDDNFVTPPTPVRDGSQQSNAPLVRGAGGGVLGDVFFAAAKDGAAVIRDGLLESVESVSTISDYNSATQAAASQLDLRSRFVGAESCQLAPSAPFSIDDLVPGALCQVNCQETCLPIVGEFRLKQVSVSASFGQDDSIDITIQPKGTN